MKQVVFIHHFILLLAGLIIVTLLNISFLPAQIVHFVHFGTESGLPQSQIQTIEQDKFGNLWLGTLSGLAKYNGREFVTYNKHNGLAEDWITTSFKDRDGNLWFGHWTGGLSKYNIQANTFETIALEDFFEFRSVTAIIQDSAGNFWFGSFGSGLIKYESKSNKIILINKSNGLSSNNVTCLFLDSFGNIWIGTDNGITIYNSLSDINSPGSFAYLGIPEGLPGNYINTVRQVFSSQLWIAVAGAGIKIYNLSRNIPVNDISKSPQFILGNEQGLATGNINAILPDTSGTVWLGTQDAGVIRFIPDNRNSVGFPPAGIFRQYTAANGLNYNRVNTLFADREGNIWIGTDLGLNQYRGEQFHLFDESCGIINNIIWSVCADRKGNIWFGTNEGVTMLTPLPQSTSDYIMSRNYNTTNFTVKDGLPGNSVRAIFEDGSGNIWFGTAGGGAAKLDEHKKFKTYSASNGMADNIILSICDDEKGNIWFGTPHGASAMDLSTEKIINYGSISGLGGNSVFRLFKDSKGNLWFGSLGGALTMFNDNKFTVFDEANGLFHKFILSIAEDKSGNVWFGTYGGGVYKYFPDHPVKSKFMNFSREIELGAQTPYSIITDNNGYLWFGTNNGINLYNQKENISEHYGRKEGFLGIENNASSVAIDNDGNIWFGTIMGALKFNPRLDQSNRAEPITVISKIRLKQKDTLFTGNAILPYNLNSVIFYFIGVSLTSPDKVRYQYKLDGFDADWSESTSDNFASYQNLPHGAYTFSVKACNDSGVWNSEPVAFGFLITRPVWLTWWFIVSCILLAVAAIYSSIRIRERSLILEKRHLEAIVQERTQELAQKNKDITDSITYAKRIQEALLPTDWDTKLPESFILFKPKAIVSGDFYWLAPLNPPIGEKQKTHSSPNGESPDSYREGGAALLFAACDCTGHGVPGAFMSMLCSSLLNEAVIEKRMTQPAAILDEVRKGIITTLKQRGQSGEQKDGMDAAICSLTKTGNGKIKLMAACANNPIWIVRNAQRGAFTAVNQGAVRIKSQTHEFKLFEIPADRQPVAISEKMQPFSHYELDIEPGDSIYLFSDGMEDQFGGPEGKKFKEARVRELILTMAGKPMKEQLKIVEKTVNDWMGDYEQLDDILMVSVKV